MPVHPVCYLGRSRLQRNRANLFQTLKTCDALVKLGVPLGLYLPPWRNCDSRERLTAIGVAPSLPVVPLRLLHRRWPEGLFVAWHGRSLRDRAVYVRDPRLAVALAQGGIRLDFEVHQVRALNEAGLLQRVVDAHRRGVIRYLLPISRAAAVALVEAGCNGTRLAVLPSAVDYEAFAAIPRLTADAFVAPVALYAGRISRSRGLDILAHLAASDVLTVRLLGEAEDPVPSLPSMTHAGFVAPSALPEAYAAAQIALLPYQPDLGHSDAISPLKLFEAMAAGRAIIASDLPPVREILAHGINGLLVPPRDLRAWEGAVRELIANPADASELGARAREDARRHSWTARAQNMIDQLDLPVILRE
jgi:glycosyltransferase involved in cell wall biosynthesis